MERLNFGCGFVQPPDWVNVDKLDYGQSYLCDVLQGLPFPDDHFGAIVANHSVQMIRFDDIDRALTELRRILQPCGVLRILVPDAAKAITRWLNSVDEFPIAPSIEGSRDGRFLRYLFWHGDSRSCFTAASLTDTLHRNGFTRVTVCGYADTDHGVLDSREDESLTVEAVK